MKIIVSSISSGALPGPRETIYIAQMYQIVSSYLESSKLPETKSKKFFISSGIIPLEISTSEEDQPGNVLYTGEQSAR